MALAPYDLLAGAAGDLRELEYISALMQTDRDVRMDCSLRVQDIRLHLSSRYGIEVTDQEVRDRISKGLGDGCPTHPDFEEHEEDGMLDMMQVLALLLIPTLRKAAVSVQVGEVGTKQERYDDESRELISTPPGMLETVLSMILNDATGSKSPKKLDAELLKKIFIAYGEVQIASNDKLLQEMVECATISTESDVHLDVQAFAAGLTSDIQLYDINNETRRSTFMYDVFGDEYIYHKQHDDIDDDTTKEGDVEGAPEGAGDAARPIVVRNFTAPSIDVTADTHRSKGLMVFLWTTLLISFFAYAFSTSRLNANQACSKLGITYAFSLDSPWSSNAGAIGCELVASIVVWFSFFFVMAFYGLALVSIGSFGNYLDSPMWKPIVGVIAVVIYLVVLSVVYNPPNQQDAFLLYASLFLGVITIVFHVLHIVTIFFTRSPGARKWIKAHSLFHNWLSRSQVFPETHLKQACSLKVSNMTQNALDIVRVQDSDNATLNSCYAQALDEYARSGKKYEKMGGFTWTWKRLFSNEIYEQDGIWISTRLIASNISQLIVAFYLLLAGIILYGIVSANYDSGAAKDYLRKLVNETLTSTVSDSVAKSVADTTGSDSGFLQSQTQSILNVAVDAAVETLYPTKKVMVLAPIVFGTLFAFITAMHLVLSYMPSVIKTLFQLRRGGIETLRDKEINRYRVAPDQVSILTGSLFWGCVIGSLVVGGMIGAIVFFFLWQVTAYFAQRLVAILFGVITIIITRIFILSTFRTKYYTALYRQRPAAANMTILGLEWATFALSAGFVLIRTIKILFVAAFFIGRLDRPFVAPGVGRFFCIDLDGYPMVHTKDLLLHEAHRHPFIELLGVTYMLKLRYGDDYGKSSGSCWRLLFVYALFPWLHRYRLNARPDMFDKNRRVSPLNLSRPAQN